MSWHHQDWLSLAQAAATLIAIVGAFGVVFLQRRFEDKRNERRNSEVRKALQSIVRRSHLLVEGIRNGEIQRLFGISTNKHQNPDDVFQRFQKVYRASVIRSAHAIYTALDLLPLERLSEANCIEPLLRVREALSNLVDLIETTTLNREGAPTGPGMTRFQHSLNLVDLAMSDLGLKAKKIFDASTGESAIGVAHTPVSIPDDTRNDLP